MIDGPHKKIKAQIEKKLLSIVYQFLISLDRKRAAETLNLQSKISQDLGIDSLGRVELFHQIEEAFSIYLPDNLLAEADTLLDIALNLENSGIDRELISHIEIQEFSETKINPSQCQSLVDILIQRGTKESHKVHIYLQDEKGIEHPITYGELLDQAIKVAAGFKNLGLNPGETVAIMLPTCKEFFYTFMGALLAGLVAVPIYPPIRPDKIEEYALREAVILKNAEVRVMVTFSQAEKLSTLLKVFIPSLKTVVTTSDLLFETKKFPSLKISPDASAFIQYTSGSTSDPKGVLLSHGNLLANIRAISEVIQIKPGDVGVSWLPLYHDMGLIGCWLTSFYHAMPVVIMSPLAFLSRPERWLWSIHLHRGTLSAAPNFAYELCVKKITPEAIEGIDLSSWRLSFNGAEAINPKTLERFNEKFKDHGLRSNMMFPAYGLAECSVGLALPVPGAPVRVDTIDKELFETEQRAVPAQDPTNALSFVCEGRAIPGHTIRIIDDAGHDVDDRVIGRVIFKGPSMMQGYYRNPEATAAAMVGEYIDSGDYAYQIDGEIFITGRRKDLIIKAGRNYYPEEIEGVIAGVEGARKGCIIAFGVHDDRWSTEKLVVVLEHKLQSSKEHSSFKNEISSRVNNAIGIPPDEIILIPPGAIPKTSSGKLQRSKCKAMYSDKKLTAKRVPMWIQIARLSLKAGVHKLWRSFKKTCRFFYSIYVYLVLIMSVPGMWLFSIILPQKIGRSFVKGWARLALCLSGMPVRLVNKQGWAKSGKCIYVANHSSYIDAVVLFSVLPSKTLLIGKKEVFKYPFIGRIAKTLGAMPVDRYDFAKNIEDTKKITEYVSKEGSIALFPEGTFTYMVGIRDFKLGAFRIAADTKASIIPLAIRGTRNIFRGTNPLLCPGKITVIVNKPIEPLGDDWEEVTRMHRCARQILSEASQEPLVEF